jgi:hypothetical protein
MRPESARARRAPDRRFRLPDEPSGEREFEGELSQCASLLIRHVNRHSLEVEAIAMSNNRSNAGSAAGSGAIYGLGIFGAWVFFWQQAGSFWEYVWAFLQGIFWPAFMVYEVFKNLAS